MLKCFVVGMRDFRRLDKVRRIFHVGERRKEIFDRKSHRWRISRDSGFSPSRIWWEGGGGMEREEERRGVRIQKGWLSLLEIRFHRENQGIFKQTKACSKHVQTIGRTKSQLKTEEPYISERYRNIYMCNIYQYIYIYSEKKCVIYIYFCVWDNIR